MSCGQSRLAQRPSSDALPSPQEQRGMLLFAHNKVPVLSGSSCAKVPLVQKLCIFILSQWSSFRGYFVPWETFVHAWRYSFHCHKLLGGWGGLNWHLVGRVLDAVKYYTTHRTIPQTKSYPVQSSNVLRLRNPGWSKGEMYKCLFFKNLKIFPPKRIPLWC